MSSIWIVLFDISGSMDDGFSGAPSNDPLAERGRWRTKLEAAKELILRQVAASRVQDVAVFTFADTAEKIYHGSRTDFPLAEATIRDLTTDGRTNLASAFVAVYEDQTLESYSALSVLVLSDGLSNVGDPRAAAEQLIERYPFARIDTILIDETPEGSRVADEVSINGSVKPAFSVQELDQALGLARASSLQQELAGLATRRLNLQTEIAIIANRASPSLLTVSSPLQLTAISLRQEIVPTLEGLEAIQRAASDVQGRGYTGTISSISQDSPVSISLTGFKEAVELVLEWVIPWRRRNAELLAHLKVEQAEMDIEKSKIQNHQSEVALAASKLELAEKMLAALDPDHEMSQRRRQRLLQQFVTGIDQISKSSMEFKTVSPSSGGGTSAIIRQ